MLTKPGVPAGEGRNVSETEIKLDAGRLPVHLKSNLHPWMKSYVLPLSHPCFSVTDESGRFEIKHLPKGEHEFAIWHETESSRENDRLLFHLAFTSSGAQTLFLGELPAAVFHLKQKFAVGIKHSHVGSGVIGMLAQTIFRQPAAGRLACR